MTTAATSTRFVERRARAMGTDVHVLVTGEHAVRLGMAAMAMVDGFEQRWSRFLEDSELSRLNRSAGSLALIPRDTYELVAAAVDAWRRTDGRFDPTVLEAVVAAGYDRSFESIDRTIPSNSPVGPAPGCAGIVLHPDICGVELPGGVGLDLGGIAKGWTADLIAQHLVESGATGALVNIGGDLSARGDGPEGSWAVDVDGPFGGVIDHIELSGRSALATSTSMRRRLPGGHHLIDPATGTPAEGATLQVTVLAEHAAAAEVWAKAAFLSPEPATLLDGHGLSGLVVTTGGIHPVGAWGDR